MRRGESIPELSGAIRCGSMGEVCSERIAGITRCCQKDVDGISRREQFIILFQENVTERHIGGNQVSRKL